MGDTADTANGVRLVRDTFFCCDAAFTPRCSDSFSFVRVVGVGLNVTDFGVAEGPDIGGEEDLGERNGEFCARLGGEGLGKFTDTPFPVTIWLGSLMVCGLVGSIPKA